MHISRRGEAALRGKKQHHRGAQAPLFHDLFFFRPRNAGLSECAVNLSALLSLPYPYLKKRSAAGQPAAGQYKKSQGHCPCEPALRFSLPRRCTRPQCKIFLHTSGPVLSRKQREREAHLSGPAGKLPRTAPARTRCCRNITNISFPQPVHSARAHRDYRSGHYRKRTCCCGVFFSPDVRCCGVLRQKAMRSEP
jgi:hypothetical protein